MATNQHCPALIDPPAPDAPFAEWLAFRDELARMTVPGTAPFIRQADRIIARLSRR